MPLTERQKGVVAFVEEGFKRVTGRKVDYDMNVRSENLLIGCNYESGGYGLWSRSREDGNYVYFSIMRGKHVGPMKRIDMRVVDVRKFDVPRINAYFDPSVHGGMSAERLKMNIVHSERFLSDAEFAFGQLDYGATADDFVENIRKTSCFYRHKARGRNVITALPGIGFKISLTLPEYIAPPVRNRTRHVLAAAEKTLKELRNP